MILKVFCNLKIIWFCDSALALYRTEFGTNSKLPWLFLVAESHSLSSPLCPWAPRAPAEARICPTHWICYFSWMCAGWRSRECSMGYWKVLAHHMEGVPSCRSLHKFGQFSISKRLSKSYSICVLSGKIIHNLLQSLNLLARGRTRFRGWKPKPENSH